MKKINILVTLLSFCLIIEASQGSKSRWVRTRKSGTTTTKQTGHRPTTSTKKGTINRPNRPTSTLKAPEGVDPLVWSELSREQQDSFNELKVVFENKVKTVSRNYPLWQKAVIAQAKTIIDLNKELLDYCISTISDELEATADDRGINANAKIKIISGILKRLAIQKKTMTHGTIDQRSFDDVVKNVEVNEENNEPTNAWLEAVINTGTSLLINDKNLTVKNNIEMPVKNALIEQGIEDTDISRIIKYISQEVQKNLVQEEQQKNPEFVYQTFRNLLLNLGQYWDKAGIRPSTEWKNAMIDAGKRMRTIVGMSIADIEQQIGAEVFFVAVTTERRPLNQTESKNLEDWVTNLKMQIENK